MTKNFGITLAFVLAVSLSGALTGCGGSKSASSSGDGAYAETTAAAAGSGSYSVNQAAPLVAETAAAQEAESAASGALTSADTLQPVTANRKLIRNVNLEVETTDFDTLTASISDSVTTSGGYIEQSNLSGNSISGGSGSRYASITARVPSDHLDTFITQVEQQGNVINRFENTQDVTLQYSDIESRKKSLTIEQDRLWALLEKADTLESVIALEERLSEIRYQLESFESQLRTFDNQVDYSTVSISISEVAVFTPTSPDSISTRIQKGFSRNLASAENTMINLLVWFVAGLPILLPLAVIVLFVILLIRRFTRKSDGGTPKKKKKQPVPPVPPAPADKKDSANS